MVGCVAAKFRVEWWEKLGVVKYAVILFTIPKFKTSISLFYSIKCNFLLLNTLSANLTNHCFILSSHFQPTPSFSFSFLSISLLFSSHLISSISFPLPFFSLFIAISSLSLLWPQTLIHYLIPFHFLSNFTTHNLFFFFIEITIHVFWSPTNYKIYRYPILTLPLLPLLFTYWSLHHLTFM